MTRAGGAEADWPLLTDEEHEAMALSAQLANLVRRIIGDGPQAEHDWNEMAQRIHAIQHTVLAQAAARAYPALYRPLGGVIDGTNGPKEDACLSEQEPEEDVL